MSNLNNHKVDHLFLLVGENPLPNYVAARTLLREDGIVYLVFTNQTKNQKNCLLGVDGLAGYKIKRKEIDLANYESNSYHIRERVQKQIKSLSPGSVGLNYTGGTKAMAVHAYKAVQELKPDAVFSYLDPRSLKMCIEQQSNKTLEFDVHLKLSFEEMFKLHNRNYWLESNPPDKEGILPDAAAKILEIYQDETLAENWKLWRKTQLRRLTKNGDYWKTEEEIKNIKSIPLQELCQPIKDILRQELDTSATEIRLDITRRKGFKSFRQICEWLDGTWLESYVLKQVQNIKNEYDIKDCMMSFHIKDTNIGKGWRERFEFDVAFIKSYQLFAISCTTSKDHKLCKQKLFEAHLRARQLGGDEARVALVCLSEQPGWIRDEVRFAISDKKIKIFGSSDLTNLADGIADWIESNNEEANA
ncbi:Card1-like endonuclease domain-containing protein [Nostoc sp.]|uniref:Card1-like endonuclease domain-containing protein n=1 Tax=Nostoc sp. TaxID=1180 RepID=UPI002FF7B923